MIGPQVASWLRHRIDPSKVYDHRVLHELVSIDIGYDERAHQLWMRTGEIATVAVYTPAQLMNHPVVEIAGIYDPGPEALSTLGFELSAALHALLWSTELPPGRPESGWQVCFEANVLSIAARGAVPYRDTPPGGWWREFEQPIKTRRR